MTDTVERRALKQRAEARALAAVMARLGSRFPELSSDDIARAVIGHHDGFQGSSIREFVPILVERSARNDLQAEVRRHRA